MFQKMYRENQKTHFIFNNFVSKIVLFMRYVEKYGRAGQTTDDDTIRLVRFACWINKATNTHSQYVKFIAFPRQQLLHERASVLTFIRTLVSFSLSPSKNTLYKKCSHLHGRGLIRYLKEG